MGRAVGRWDWWNLRAEHTDYEWACQIALYIVAPWGERRADTRAAINTTHLISAQASQDVTVDDMQELMGALSSYLKCDTASEDLPLDPDALERMRRNAGNR